MKDIFLSLIDSEIPDAVAKFASVEIPVLAEVGFPSDVETAIIAEGTLAANVNLILKQFEGLTPVELILRNGGRNPLLKAIVIASYGLFKELSINRLSELKASLQDISARLDSIAASGEVSQDDLRAFTLGTQGISGVVGSLGDEEKGAVQSTIDAIKKFVSDAAEVGTENIKTLAEALKEIVQRTITLLP